MAVIESKGDGYALYNGVKLPNIDSLWTDKEKYPYAYICHVSAGNVPDGYSFTIASRPAHWFSFDSTLALGWSTGGVEIKVYLYAPSIEDLSSGFVNIIDKELSKAETFGIFDHENTEGYPVWSNTDILNTDGTVYFDASVPIPLDGMTVIEWDGVTDGLEGLLSNYYRIADYSPASSGVAVVSVVGEDFHNATSFFVTDPEMPGVWGIAKDSTSKPTVYSLSDTVAPAFGVPAGIYAQGVKGIEGDTLAVWMGLVAYTPASTEPEDTTKKDFWNGVACGLCGSGTPNFSDTSPFGVGYITGCKLRALREPSGEPVPVYE